MVSTNERQVIKMKRYDEVVRVRTHRHGIVSSVRGWNADELKHFFTQLDRCDILIECRDCGCIHNMNADCPVCDLSVKLRPEIMKLKSEVI